MSKFFITLFLLAQVEFCFAIDSSPIFLIHDSKLNYGFININGEVTAKPQFSRKPVISYDVAKVEANGKCGLVDRFGKPITDFKFSCTSGYLEFYRNSVFAEASYEGVLGKKGLVDKSGKFVVQPIFDFIGTFSEGLASARLGDKQGYIDQTGEFVMTPKVDLKDTFLGLFSEGFAAVTIRSSNFFFTSTPEKCLFINKSGDIVFDKEFEGAFPFSNGLATVKKGGKYGFINKTGDFVIPPIYDTYEKFLSDVIMVKDCKIIDRSGKIIKEFDLNLVSACTDFDEEGFAAIKLRNDSVERKADVYFIDKTGRPVFDRYFYGVETFKNGLASVEISKDVSAYINKQGQIVSPLNIDDNEKFLEAKIEYNKLNQSIKKNNSPIISNHTDSVSNLLLEMITSISSSTPYFDNIAELQKKIESLPKPPHGNRKEARKLNDQALVLAKNSDYQAALLIMEAAYKADPADVEIIGNIGYLQIKLSNFPAAKKALFEALSLKPNRNTAWADLGNVFAAEGNDVMAKNCYIIFFLSSKNSDEAFKDLTTEVKDNPVLNRAKEAAFNEVMTWTTGD